MANPTLKEFFQEFFGESTGYLELRAFFKDTKIQKFYSIPDELDKAIKDAKVIKNNVFFGVNPRSIKKGSKDAVKQVVVLHADVDFKIILKENLDKQIQLLPLKPSIIVNSGRGYHIYFLLKEPYIISSTKDIEIVEQIMRNVAHLLNGDFQCCEIARILRVPTTLNVKYEKPLSVEIIEFHPELRYTLDDFDIFPEYIPPKIEIKKKEEEIPHPDIALILNKCKAMKYCVDKASILPEPLWYSMVSNFASFPKTDDLIHQFSEPYSNYSMRETDAKIKHAKKDTRPHSCQFIRETLRENNIEDFCKDCGFYNMQTSPAGIPYIILIVEKDNCYYIKDPRVKTGLKKISSFIIKPLIRIIYEDNEKLDAVIETQSNRTYRTILEKRDWTGKYYFKSAMYWIDTQFIGTDDNIQNIKNYISFQKCILKRGVKVLGLHKIDNKWHYIDNEKCIFYEKGIQERDDMTFIEETSIKTSITKKKSLTKDELKVIKDYLFEFNDHDVSIPIIAWASSCFIKERLFRITEEFPILSIFGEAGSGKTKTAQKVIYPFFSLHHPIYKIDSETKFTLIRKLSMTNLIPNVFDEYKTSKMTPYKLNEVSSILRNIYNNIPATRGRADLSAYTYLQVSPVMLMGEDELTEISIRQRIVEVMMTRRKSEKHTEIFNRLHNLNLSSLGRDFLYYTLSIPDKKIEEIYYEQLGQSYKNKLKDRIAENSAIIKTGLHFLNEFLEIETPLEFIDGVMFENIYEQKEEALTVVDKSIEKFNIMAGSRTPKGDYWLMKNIDYRIDDDILHISINHVYPRLKKYAREYADDIELINLSSFKKQLKKRPYFKEETRKWFGEVQKRCYALDMNVLEGMGIELYGFKHKVY